ncbi:hypothetical protein D1872_255150 [compost metagenome]
MAAAISATERAAARVMTPPAAQARMPIPGVPAWPRTIPGFKKIPDPMIIPMTSARASIKVTDFFSVPRRLFVSMVHFRPFRFSIQVQDLVDAKDLFLS